MPIEFVQEISRHGMSPPDHIEPGKWVRFPGAGKKSGNTAGAAYLFPDLRAGVFCDFSNGDEHHIWKAEMESSLSDADIMAGNILIDAKRKEVEKQRAEFQKEKALEARKYCNSLKPATDHPYLENKGVKSHNLLIDGDKLIMPLFSCDGSISTYQEIHPDGRKKLMYGGRKKGASFFIPAVEQKDNDTVFLCEGYSTGAAVYEAIGKRVVIAIDAGNLKPVAEDLLDTGYSKIVIAADNDWHQKEQWEKTGKGKDPGEGTGIEKAKAVCERYPSITWLAPDRIDEIDGNPCSGTDWNDFFRVRGAESVRKKLLGEKPKLFSFSDTNVNKNLTCLPEQRKYLVDCYGRGFLPEGIVGEICAAGGSGKSIFAMQFAHMMAGGERGFYPFSVSGKPKKVLYISLEDDQPELDRRLWAVTEFGANKPPGLHALSLVGQDITLMETDEKNNAVRTPVFDMLDESISGEGLDCLIIDPFSRAFTGLNENDNGHGTAIVKACEFLSQKHKCAVLLVHHANKQSQNNNMSITQGMGRGASAVVDGCRFMLGMCGFSDSDLERFSINYADRYKYVKAELPKANYSGKFAEMYFELCHIPETDTVVMKHMDISGGLIDQIINYILLYITEEGPETRRNLTRIKGGYGSFVKEKLGEEVTISAMKTALKSGIESGLFIEGKVPKKSGKGGAVKKISLTKKGQDKVFFIPEFMAVNNV